MTTLDLAKRKWARKMRDAGPRWKAGVTGKADEYASGLGQFAGVTTGPTLPAHYREGVDAVSPEDFASAVAGKEERWASRLREAITS